MAGGTYALLLTDMHMPVMDGYALATAIRNDEAQPNGAAHRRMPILALTANALQGEAKRAEAAGVDEYLTKPMQLNQLRTVLAKWLPNGKAMPFHESPPEPLADAQRADPFDMKVLKNLTGDDPRVVHDSLSGFRESCARQAVQLRVAFGARDARRIGVVAHELKSASRQIGALALGDACTELENTCRSGVLHELPNNMAVFETALHAAEGQMRALLA